MIYIYILKDRIEYNFYVNKTLRLIKLIYLQKWLQGNCCKTGNNKMACNKKRGCLNGDT